MRQITYLFILLLRLTIVAAGFEAAAALWSQAASPEPLTEAKILDGLTRGGITSKRMATLVEERGVDFALTSEIEKALRNAGAGDDLIEAVKRAKVKPKASLVIDTDADCTVTVNGTTFDMKTGEQKIMIASVGENAIRAVSQRDAAAVWRRVVQVQQSEQKAVLIELGNLEKPPSDNNHASSPAAGTTKTNSKDGQKYVWIPSGTFQMGCSAGDRQCYDDEKPSHRVTITKGFWLGQTPVTHAAYQAVTGGNPSLRSELTAELVTWNEAKTYCETVGGRLPTEAEWEYAARAGNPAARYGELDAIAWYEKNSGGRSHEVGQKQANAWNLYDMLGNVWEWVEDRYDENYYAKSPSTDPTGPEVGPVGQYRVVRGGSWSNESRVLRSSFRSRYYPDISLVAIGFRCAREVFP
jgi:formylglycine-generating enzyme required for sulfatase activity